MSNEQQVLRVANNVYRDAEDLVLLYIDYESIKDDVKWEGSEEYGEDFPHLYTSLPIDAVVRVEDLRKDDNGNYIMPKNI